RGSSAWRARWRGSTTGIASRSRAPPPAPRNDGHDGTSFRATLPPEMSGAVLDASMPDVTAQRQLAGGEAWPTLVDASAGILGGWRGRFPGLDVGCEANP